VLNEKALTGFFTTWAQHLKIKEGINMPEQQQSQRSPEPAPWHKDGSGGGDPISPKIEKPDTRSILEKMKRVAPNQAKRYVQRQGE
jgi:hypothetical protein